MTDPTLQANLKALDMLGFSTDVAPTALLTALFIMALRKPERFKRLVAAVNQIKDMKEHQTIG